MKKFDVVIIGGGASGFSCAAQALKLGKTVAILEHNLQPLKKVKISGGGRCNFTNLNTAPEKYLCSKGDFVKHALQIFSPQKIISLMQKHHIPFAEKELGQLFTKTSSQDIIDALIKEAEKAKTFYGIEIETVEKSDGIFKIRTKIDLFEAKSLVIATGGMSYQNIGAGDLGYRIAKQFGLKIIPYRPALVPFNLDNELMKKTIKLKGIALDCLVECDDRKFRNNILFTHFGISGPAILQASLYWLKDMPVRLNFLPETDLFEFLKQQRETAKKKKISSILKQFFPERFVEFLVEERDIFISETSNKQLKEISQKVNQFTFTPIGTQGFKLAEVTAGGVDTDEIDTKTFESKKIKGLYFIGEVLDVAGQLGGYNLQWAWASGFCAGENL
ncbi:MAG: NAD(P)/FAD-dependent oxidoreductase [Alphaproteobacteria bacterium]